MADADSRKKEYNWNLDFAVNLGDTHRRFFDALEEKRIIGNKCTETGRVYIPPQPHDDETLDPTDEWVEADGEGVVESYVVTFMQFRNMPEPPYVTGVIRIGDSDTCLLHFIGGIEYDEPEDLLDAVEKGMRVRPVWREDRTGSIEDIRHFEPVE
jgi:hypothetical protein